MEIYLKLVDVFFPVFLVIGIGFYFGKKNPKFDTDFITKLTGTFGTPALIFYSLTSTGVNLETFIEFFTYKIIMVSGFAFVGIITLILTKRDIIYELPPLILPNNGNIGLSVCLFAYGNTGFGIAGAIASVIMLLHFTLGIALTKLKVFSFKLSLINSFTRMFFGPIIGLLIIYAFNLSGVEAGVIFIQSSMPSAILTYLVGSMYSPKKVVDSIASTIFVSTTISFFTLPIVVYLSLKYFV